MTNKDSTIQNKIRYYRFMNDVMTQQELADRIGVSRQTIITIENEKYSPSLELAFRIAEVFDVGITDIFIYKNGEERK